MNTGERPLTPRYGVAGEPRSADVAVTVATAMILLLVLVFVATL